MEFKEVYMEALRGRFVKACDIGTWRTLNSIGEWVGLDGEKCVGPSTKAYTWNTWQIKPEEIFVWVVNDGDRTMLTEREPYKEGDLWFVDDGGGRGFYDLDFPAGVPTDKPQKFKLVPVEED